MNWGSGGPQNDAEDPSNLVHQSERVGDMSKKAATDLNRRDFFRKAGLGAGVVGAAAAGLSAKAKAASPDKSSPKSAGYRETDLVKKYYELARF